MDAFALFGLPRRYAVDPVDLRQRFVAQSRALHPDYFGTATPAEQDQALARSSELNAAYRLLQDPIRRAEHLLTLEGHFDAAGQTQAKLSPEFMMEIMELGERATDAHHAEREVLSAQLSQRLALQFEQIERTMLVHDVAPSASLRASALAHALELLLQRRALQRVLEQFA